MRSAAAAAAVVEIIDANLRLMRDNPARLDGATVIIV